MLSFSNIASRIGIFLICINCFSQDIVWERSYGGKYADYLFDAQPSADYGFILGGSSLSKKTGNKTDDNMGNFDYWIWKMDESGDAEWQKSLGGEGMDMLYSIANTRDGGFILAGTSDSHAGLQKKDSCRGKDDFWIVKLNAKGHEEWQKTIGGNGQEMLKTIIQTDDKGYIIGGSSASDISDKLKRGIPDPYGKWEKTRGNMDAWVVKLDEKGIVKWQRTLGGRYFDQLESIQQTKDGGYILGVYSNSPASVDKEEDGYGKGDYWLIKLDRDGNTQWQKIFGGEGDDHIYSFRQTHDGGYIAGGSSASGANGTKIKANRNGSDIWLIRLDENAEELWQETYNTGKADILLSIHENKDGSFMLGGYTRGENIVSRTDAKEINDYLAININAKGKEQWRRAIGSSDTDVLRKMIETRDGAYILAGTSEGATSRDRSSGKGSNDFWIVKLKDKSKKEGEEYKSMLEAIPNPVQQYTNIIVGFEFTSGTATVYDLSGRLMQTQEVTERTIPIDMGGYPQGVYIVEVVTNTGKDSVKVLKGKN